jgi:hypothetical protein
MRAPFRPTAPTCHIVEGALDTALSPTKQAVSTRAVAFADEAVQKKAVAPR